MKVKALNKIKSFRISYLLVSLVVCGFVAVQLMAGIVSSFRGNVDFSMIIDLFCLLFALLFEVGILLFIIRSLRSHQTLMMKNLVFKIDGTPFRPGVISAAVGGSITTIAAVFFLCCGYGLDIFPNLSHLTTMFIASVSLIFAVNLDFLLVYFLLLRHEASAFALI